MATKIRQKTFRQKLKKPDEFISTSAKVLGYLKKNYKSVISSLVLFLVILISVHFIVKRSKAKKEAFYNKMYDDMIAANSNFKENELDKAEKLFNEVIRNEKSSLFNEIARVSLGYTHMENKAYDKSIAIFDELVSKDDLGYPKEELYKSLATLYEMTGKEKKAVEIYQKLISLYPTSTDLPSYIRKLGDSAKFKHP
tara:strand:+ start:183 stop:773 length:591 start_codon:yes stop_codon:yes gene_type:complete